MQANLNKLYNYTLRSSNKQFLIPVYQRNYSWTQSQCKTLMDDILKLYNGEYTQHFMGSIIYKVEQGNSDLANVIDGQQRLSTMFLLCKAIHDFSDDEDVKREMSEILIDRWKKTNRLVPVKSDNEVYEKIISNDFDLIVNSENRMYQNYKFFIRFLESANVDIKKLIASLEKLEVIIMELHEGDNPQVIFESINSTGLSLTNADLIRNFLLLGENYEVQTDLYNNYWFRFEKLIGYDNINIFFEHFLNIKSNSKGVSRNTMYLEFKDYVVANKYSASEVFEILNDYVEVYKYFVNDSFTYELENSKDTKLLTKYFNELNELSNNVSRMFLMEVLLSHKNGDITDQELLYTFKLVISYIFRRSICNYGTNSMQKMFRFLYSQVSRNIGDINYIDSLHHNFITTKVYTKAKFPDDVEFMEELSTRNLYGKFRNLDYLLFSIENHNNKTILDTDEVTIEHVMPQTLTKYWKDILGENHSQLHADLVHDIGNLTLTSYNSNLSNKSFEDKLEILKSESHIKLNQYFNGIVKWDAAEIEKRSKMLSEVAKDIWVYPEINTDIEVKIEDSKYRTLTFADLYNDYESVSFKSVSVNDEYTRDIWSFRDLCEVIVEMCYTLDKERFEDNFIDNHNHYRSTGDITLFYYSYNEESVFAPRVIKEFNLYFDVSKPGRTLLSMAKSILDVYEIDMEDIELKVYL